MSEPVDSPFEHGELDAATYATFIQQIELRDIWLLSAHVTNHHGPSQPERIAINIDSATTYENCAGGFQTIQTYRVRAENDEILLIEIEVAFALDFHSQQSMTKSVFDVFAEYNLPVNTWPYLREFVATTVGRMGWIPFTLPALKRGTQASSPQEDSTPTTTKRARRSPNSRPSKVPRRESAE